MIFYLANNRTLAPTQAEARQLDRDFVQHDIPTDKAGLMAYVQNLLDQVHTEVPVEPATPPPPADWGQDMSPGHDGQPIVPPAEPTLNFERVEDWIFDHATPAQVERVFAALGARFHEMRKSCS